MYVISYLGDLYVIHQQVPCNSSGVCGKLPPVGVILVKRKGKRNSLWLDCLLIMISLCRGKENIEKYALCKKVRNPEFNQQFIYL